MIRSVLILIAGAGLLFGCQNKKYSDPVLKYKGLTSLTNASESLQIPESIKAEHSELDKKLNDAIKLPGKTGSAAKEVAVLLKDHFAKEEKYALPPLGLLPELSKGKTPTEMKQAINLSDELKKNLPQMLEDHKKIIVLLDKLTNAARSENHPEVIEFAENLKLHAQTEEEILYPSTLLIGEFLKLKMEDPYSKETRDK